MVAPSYDIFWDDTLPLAWYRMAGLWDEPTQQAWEVHVHEFVKGHPAGDWYVVGDLTDFPPQRDFVNDARRRLLDHLLANGCVKGAIIVPKTVIKMQTQRIARETTDAQRFMSVTSADEALDAIGLPRKASPFGALA